LIHIDILSSLCKGDSCVLEGDNSLLLKDDEASSSLSSSSPSTMALAMALAMDMAVLGESTWTFVVFSVKMSKGNE
jgi:hypothetical protein